MLNGVVQSVNDRSRQTPQPYQSLWLAHWKRVDCEAVEETSSLNGSGSEDLDCVSKEDGSTMGSEASTRSANILGKIKKRTFEGGNDFIKAGGKSVGKERMISSIFKDGQDADDVQILIPEFAPRLERNKTVHNRNGIPSSGCHSMEEDTSDNPPMLTRRDSLFRLKPLKENSLPYKFDVEVDKFDKGKAAISVGYRHRSDGMRMLEHEQCSERKAGAPSQSHSSSDECFREEMQKSSGIRLFPSQSNSSEDYETKKSQNDCYSQLKMQKCVHGLGTMRIFTTLDVSGRTLAGFPRFSETSNDLLITQGMDANTFKGNDTFSRIFTKINGNMSGDLHSILPFSGKKDSEVKEYIRNVKASKVTIRNDLPAATDKMSMDSFKDDSSKKNLQSASNSTASAKTFNMASTEVVSSREVGNGRRNDQLHGVNLKPGAAGPSEKKCPSSSRSHSLENENLAERAKQPKKVKYNSSVDEFPIADAGNRWFKRLKLSSFNSSIQGMKSNTISSKQLFEKSMASDTSMETADDKGMALLLSHGWIRRWRQIKGKDISSEEEAICLPESTKMEVEKLEGRQLPSIAAMAMMAKALTCFQQCELQKKGSYTVWNT